MLNINVRTDEEIKAKCESLFENLGLNMSTAINIFLRQSLRVNGLPFEVKGYTNIKDLRAALEV